MKLIFTAESETKVHMEDNLIKFCEFGVPERNTKNKIILSSP